MNKKNGQAPAAAQESTPEAATFDKSTLVAQARRLFNTSPEVVAGALYDRKAPITIEQAAAKVKEFLARPIRKEGGN